MERNQSTIKRRSDKLTSMKSHPNVIEVASKLAILLDSVKCSICLEVMIQPARIKCGHTFCTLCIENAIQFNKADAGTLLRKISGGSAKADCPLCKMSNITKRGITADPVLEKKIKILKELQNNIRGAAKELGFELDSVRNVMHKKGTIEARSGLTPMKNPSKKNDKISKAIVNTARIFDTQSPTYWGEVTESAPKIKTYSSGKKKVTVHESKIARRFNKPGPVVLSKRPDASVYDEMTDESPPRKLQKRYNPKHQALKISSPKDDAPGTPGSTSSSLSLHSLNKDSMPQHLQKSTKEFEDESESKNENLSLVTKPMYENQLSKIIDKRRNISFTIKGKSWANSRFEPYK